MPRRCSIRGVYEGVVAGYELSPPPLAAPPHLLSELPDLHQLLPWCIECPVLQGKVLALQLHALGPE